MDVLEKLNLLSNEMGLEPSEEYGTSVVRDTCRGVFIYNAHMPNGRHIRLLKTLLTSACENDCAYCPFRAGRDFRRTTFQPEEFAHLVSDLHRAGILDGIFISSGVVGGSIRTQDLLLKSAEILRYHFNFNGYLHLKLMPGVEFAQVERGMQLADRVSVNLEAPNPLRLKKLTLRKDFWQDLWQPLQWVESIRRTQPAYRGWNGHWPSSSTQFVIGSAGESDLELLQTTQVLHRELKLQRTYYSPFTPHKNTPLENQAPIAYRREQRLYQASFLLRDYGFSAEELSFDPNGNLPLKHDPKSTWAERHLALQPVEINRAEMEELLRIPGIGPQGARKLIKARKERLIKDISTLTKLGIQTKRAEKYILLNGLQPVLQPSLW